MQIPVRFWLNEHDLQQSEAVGIVSMTFSDAYLIFEDEVRGETAIYL